MKITHATFEAAALRRMIKHVTRRIQNAGQEAQDIPAEKAKPLKQQKKAHAVKRGLFAPRAAQSKEGE